MWLSELEGCYWSLGKRSCEAAKQPINGAQDSQHATENYSAQNINRGEVGKLCTKRKKQNKENESLKRLLCPKRRDLKKKKAEQMGNISNTIEIDQQVNGLSNPVKDKIVRVYFLNDNKILTVSKRPTENIQI